MPSSGTPSKSVPWPETPAHEEATVLSGCTQAEPLGSENTRAVRAAINVREKTIKTNPSSHTHRSRHQVLRVFQSHFLVHNFTASPLPCRFFPRI